MIAFVKRYAGFFLLLLSLGGLVFLNLGDGVAAADTETPVTTTITMPATTVAVMTVELRGEVVRPGRYAFVGEASVADAIALAGGATAAADLAGVNLAKVVYDGMVINIPSLQAAPTASVFVDVKGAVAYPGVYRIAAGLRVYDAVMLAGGFLPTADTATVNLAAPVTDAMMIAIPFASAATPDPETPETPDDDGKININTATIEELDTLYGIGYILAQRIIDYRAEFGDFVAIEEIMNVDGIKETVYEAIKGDICV